MIEHPTQGAEQSKPRFRAKGKMDELTRQKISELSEEYLQIRNTGQRAKAQREEMLLAERRDQLIEKSLVTRQAAYIFVAFRQKMLTLGQTWARRFVGLNDVRAAKALIDEMARSTLTELAQFPDRVTDPNWLDEADGNGVEPHPPPVSPTQAKRAEQAKKAASAKRKVRRSARKEKSGKWV